MTFSDVIEAIDQLSQDEQEELIDVVRRRAILLAGKTIHRRRLAAELEEARKEFASGQCRTVTPQELVRENSRECFARFRASNSSAIQQVSPVVRLRPRATTSRCATHYPPPSSLQEPQPGSYHVARVHGPSFPDLHNRRNRRNARRGSRVCLWACLPPSLQGYDAHQSPLHSLPFCGRPPMHGLDRAAVDGQTVINRVQAITPG